MTEQQILEASYTNFDYSQLSKLERTILLDYAITEQLFEYEESDELPEELVYA
ncbi:MAG: hypothetical protein VKL42_01765 [Snowella sp.]|nr:hypothetical protein [Snowella sp.]